MMIIGFTGTRKGMTIKQRDAVSALMEEHAPEYVHHGGCKGADLQFDKIAWDGIPDVQAPAIIVHPGPDTDTLIFGGRFDTTFLPREPYLKRNRAIVGASDLMIATPKSRKEELRGSGTWATIRFARKADRPLIIVWPDGTKDEQ